MKTMQFQVLLDELGGLTTVQRAALMMALKSSKSPDDVVSLLEAEFAKAPACGHCGAERFAKWGVATGMKRYICKSCSRTFNALTGTPLAHLRKREKWLEYARAIVDGLTLRKAAARVGVHLETSFRWRHRFLATSKTAKAKRLSGIVEADETFILKSAKGSRRLVSRVPRKRGGKPKKTGTSPDDYDIVLIARDRSGATTDHILYDLAAPTTADILKPLIAKDAVLVSDGRYAYAALAHAENILHIPIITSRLKAWLQPFRALHLGIFRVISVGVASSNVSLIPSRPSAFRPHTDAVQHEYRTEPFACLRKHTRSDHLNWSYFGMWPIASLLLVQHG